MFVKNTIEKRVANLENKQNRGDKIGIAYVCVNYDFGGHHYNPAETKYGAPRWIDLHEGGVLEIRNDEIKLSDGVWIPRCDVILYDDVFADRKDEIEERYSKGGK